MPDTLLPSGPHAEFSPDAREVVPEADIELGEAGGAAIRGEQIQSAGDFAPHVGGIIGEDEAGATRGELRLIIIAGKIAPETADHEGFEC